MDLAPPAAPVPAAPAPARITARLIVAAAVLGLTACAAIDRPVNQELVLNTRSAGAPVEAACELGNDRGKWTVVAPVVIGVTRSAEPLTVNCTDSEGRTDSQRFEAVRVSTTAIGSAAAYGYPPRLTLELQAPTAGTTTMAVATMPFAAIADVARVPLVDEHGRHGYQRFLEGPSPRAFAVSESGYWVRVNGSRGADRLALDRCQTAGTACKLYAVDDAVVWDRKRQPELLAAH